VQGQPKAASRRRALSCTRDRDFNPSVLATNKYLVRVSNKNLHVTINDRCRQLIKSGGVKIVQTLVCLPSSRS